MCICDKVRRADRSPLHPLSKFLDSPLHMSSFFCNKDHYFHYNSFTRLTFLFLLKLRRHIMLFLPQIVDLFLIVVAQRHDR